MLFDACLASEWGDLQRRVEVEIAARGHQMASEGVEAVLNTLHPRLSWCDDTLFFDTMTQWPSTPNPRGRGLVFLPNLMTAAVNVTTDDSRRVKAAYPLPFRAAGDPSARSGLDALIGSGRARALRAIGTGCSTAELASRLGIKAPSASEQAATLREAGLVATVREGRNVRHVLTSLGVGLLAANP